MLAIAGWFFGADAARGQLFGEVNGLVGNDAAAAVQTIVEHARHPSMAGPAAVVSAALLVVGASATFASLNTALNVVFPVPTRHGAASNIALLLKMRLISFGLVMGVAFLLVVSLVLDTVISFVGAKLFANSPLIAVGEIAQFVFGMIALSAAFATLIKMLPDAHVRWRTVWQGAIVSALLFSGGRKLFALYLTHAGTANAFGAAGSLAALMMWLYFSAVVLLLGAEIAAAVSHANSQSTVVPDHVAHENRTLSSESPRARLRNGGSAISDLANGERYVRNLVTWGLMLCLKHRSKAAVLTLRKMLPHRVYRRADGLVLLLNSYHEPIGADDAFGPVDFDASAFATLSVSSVIRPAYGALDGTPDCFFSAANEPWLSRRDAEEYVSRIEECLGIRLPADAAFSRSAALARFERERAALFRLAHKEASVPQRSEPSRRTARLWRP
ncbi:YihY/virulence factor BrkB family protein [Paraburkholderia phymatum]